MTTSMNRIFTTVFIVMRITNIMHKSHFTPATDAGEEGTYVRGAINLNVDVALDTESHSLLLGPLFMAFHCVGEAPEADESLSYSISQALIRPMEFITYALLFDMSRIYSSLQHNIYSLPRTLLFAPLTTEDISWSFKSGSFITSLVAQHASVLILSFLRWFMSRSTCSRPVPPATTGHSDTVLPTTVALLLPSRTVLAFSLIQALGVSLLQMAIPESHSMRSLPHALMSGIVSMACNIIASAAISIIVAKLHRITLSTAFTEITRAVVRVVHPVAKDFLDYSHAIHSSIAVESGNWVIALGIEIGRLLFLQRQSLRWSAYLSRAGASEGNKDGLMQASPCCGSNEAIDSKTLSGVLCSQTTGVPLDSKTGINGPAGQLDLALPFSWADDIDEWNEDFVKLVTKASRKMTRREKKQEKKRLARIDSRATKWEILELAPAVTGSSDLTSVCFAPEMTSTPCSTSLLRSEAELHLSTGDIGWRVPRWPTNQERSP